LEELNGLLSTETLLSEVWLYSLRMVGKADLESPAQGVPHDWEDNEDSLLQTLLAAYQHIFCDPRGLLPQLGGMIIKYP